ncbi:hypothetical protein Aab01nite_45890 [Paractinoplanes abujensis]|uniref:Uncharacterized protein n=1 Tax=Paractinoplanes abujensis TaxID=882441 RepID=A0A7W7FZ34_9ACTN|nr:hypothetical protein [Actinoplanes abujensis]MBB4690234.1 hypothetical protein [Actinoplanes abujensis]GID20999.1 hypothetical protein Aab01nite_45890 [Actinoplanes abujensis]
MSNLGFALEGAWKVLAAGLVLGAGLPALFALGIRALAGGRRGKPIAYGLFAVVILGVLLGITFIVASGFGKTISFEHVYPTVVDK